MMKGIKENVQKMSPDRGGGGGWRAAEEVPLESWRTEPGDDRVIRITRRGFLKTLAGLLAGLAGLEIGFIGARFLAPLKDKEEFQGVVEAGPVDRFQPGSVTVFSDEGFFLNRTEDGGFLALYRRCTHLGCTINWEPDDAQFLCPCHASHFDFYGDFVDSPVSRALDLFDVYFENGVVFVDTNKLSRREAFSPEQLAYLG